MSEMTEKHMHSVHNHRDLAMKNYRKFKRKKNIII